MKYIIQFIGLCNITGLWTVHNYNNFICSLLCHHRHHRHHLLLLFCLFRRRCYFIKNLIFIYGYFFFYNSFLDLCLRRFKVSQIITLTISLSMLFDSITWWSLIAALKRPPTASSIALMVVEISFGCTMWTMTKKLSTATRWAEKFNEKISKKFKNCKALNHTYDLSQQLSTNLM